MLDCPYYTLVHDAGFGRILKKLKRRNPILLQELERGTGKILREPMLGKPLRHSLRTYRRIHIEGSFVLLYEIRDCEVHLIDFDHHDRIYRKYS